MERSEAVVACICAVVTGAAITAIICFGCHTNYKWAREYEAERHIESMKMIELTGNREGTVRVVVEKVGDK